ncbi:winged helix-turn-helix transcriptional regulator [Granulicella cerasi]|uniref:Winged helix-turn-helix transcriptional regulator n=1 Tax=Granulicella cerasi TaxID=741063 RepID=A0ABW1Z5V3_9BACT|nr:helix-turn-helix domain-containing protein [Granulicella cerasi]
MQRKCLADAQCPIARSLDAIGDWWSLLIVRDALRGASRFCEFERSLGIARNILTQRLLKLVEEGIFVIEPAADGSAYKQYRLTDRGAGLKPVIDGLWNWGADNLYPPSKRPKSPRPFQHFLADR